jgi:hypothetical protein
LVTVIVSAGLAYASATVSQGSVTVTGATVTATLGTIAGGGSATLTINCVGAAVGTFLMSAHATSDVGVAGSTVGVAHVQAIDPGIVVTPSLASPLYGQSATFTATVSATSPGGPTPTGTVTFQIDRVTIGVPVALVNGVATSALSAPLTVGSHSVTVSYAGDSIFNPANATPLDVAVGKAHLTVTADDKSRGSGLANPPLTATLMGFVNGDGVNVVAGRPALSTTATTTSPLGNYPIVVGLGTLAAANYDFPSLVNGTLTVTSKENATATVSRTVVNPVYGQSVSFTATLSPPNVGQPTPTGAVTFLVDGVAVGSPVPLVNGVATGGAGATLNAGSHTVAVSYAGDSNFNTETTTAAAFTVAKAHLTVTADNKSRSTGLANPNFTVTISGLVNGDTASVVTGQPALSSTAVASSPPGTYPIVVGLGTLSAANYDVAKLVNGTLTVRLSTPLDFDGVGRSEIAYFWPATAQWFAIGPAGGSLVGTFGAKNLADLPVAGDYDGVGHAEMAVFRPATAQWFVMGPSGGEFLGSFGARNLADLPVPGDYDGVGHTEMAVFRPATAQWFVMGPHGGELLGSFGKTNLADIPVPGDYDGVGHTEMAVYRPATGEWFVMGPTGPRLLGTFGKPNLADIPVPGDYDGVGHTELAVYRPSTGEWFVLGPGGPRLLGRSGIANPPDLPAGAPIGGLMAMGFLKASPATRLPRAYASDNFASPQAAPPVIVATPAVLSGSVAPAPSRLYAVARPAFMPRLARRVVPMSASHSSPPSVRWVPGSSSRLARRGERDR